MAKFELNFKIKQIIENFLNDSSSLIDDDFKEKLKNVIDGDYIEFEDLKRIQLINNKNGTLRLF